jgi:hypothetical protein
MRRGEEKRGEEKRRGKEEREREEKWGRSEVEHQAYLDRGNARGQHQTLVITVHHHHGTQRADCDTPRVLPSQLLLALLVFELDVEHPGEILAEAVGCSSLQTTAIGWDDCGGVITNRKKR